MNATQTTSQKSIPLWQAAAALLLSLGLGLVINQRYGSEQPEPIPVNAVAADQQEKQEASAPPPEKKVETKQRAAASVVPTPERAFEKIKTSTEVQEILRDPKNQLVVADKVEGLGVWTMKYQHMHNGVEVLGSMATYHNGPGGEMIQSHLKDVKIPTEPKLSAKEALSLALDEVGKNSKASGKPELKIFPARGDAKLIYSVQVRDANTLPHEIWIDAQSGSLVSHMSRNGEFKQARE